VPVQTTTYEGGQRVQLSEADVVELARAHGFGVPVGWIVGVAKRESNWSPNQIDTDFDEEGNPRPAKTYGLCMIRRSEALTALSLTAIDTSGLLDPATNIKVLSTVTARHRTLLSAAAPNEYSEEDMLRYLCWAHNAGPGDSLPGIRKYGLDWQAALARNPAGGYVNTRLRRYTDAVIDFVNRYPEMPNGGDDTMGRLLVLAAIGWVGYNAFRGSAA
jgi:hypothetical protein